MKHHSLPRFVPGLCLLSFSVCRFQQSHLWSKYQQGQPPPPLFASESSQDTHDDKNADADDDARVSSLYPTYGVKSSLFVPTYGHSQLHTHTHTLNAQTHAHTQGHQIHSLVIAVQSTPTTADSPSEATLPIATNTTAQQPLLPVSASASSTTATATSEQASLPGSVSVN